MKIIIFHFILIVPLCLAAIPTILYQNSYNTYAYAAYSNDTCKQLKITNNYIVRLGTNNVLQINSKDDLQTQAQLLNYTYSVAANGSNITPNIINNFDLNQNQTFLTVAQSDSTKLLNLMNFSLKTQIIGNFYKIIYGKQIMGMKHTASGFDQISKSLSLPSAAAVQSSLPIVNFTLPNVKNCKCSQSPDNAYLVYWDQQSNIYVFANSNNTNAPTYKGKISSKLTIANLTQAICFSRDSQYFILEADDQLFLSIISLTSTAFLSKRSVQFNGVINKAMFLDGSNQYIILFNDTAYTLISTITLSVIYSRNLTISTDIIEIDYLYNTIYVCKDQIVDIYSVGSSISNCSDFNCMACINQTQCIQCILGYQLAYATCIQQTNINNGSVTNNTSINATDVLDIDIQFNNSTTNSSNTYNNGEQLSNNSMDTSDNSTIFYYIMPDGSVMVYQITYAQAYLINATQQALKYTNEGLQKLMVFLTSTPFMFLIIGNIQFFSVSSLYIFLNIPIPLDIYNTLRSTIDALNCNVFTIFNISVRVPVLSYEKVGDSKALELGASSQFLASNYQYFILSFGIVVLMSIGRCLLSVCRCCDKLRDLIEQNRLSVIFGLLLSGLPAFTLPFVYQLSQPQTIDTFDRLNLAMQLLVIGLIISFCPVFISCIGHTKNTKNQTIKGKQFLKNKVKKGSLGRLWKQRDSIYIILLNILFPMLVVLRQPLYFLTINLLLLFFGLRNAVYSKQYRVNKIILNSYPIIFHICFLIFNFSSKLDIIVMTQIICLLIYFIGAVHQFFTIIFQFAVFIYHLIKDCHTNKIAPDSAQQQNKRESQKKETVWHFTIKPKQNNRTYNFKYRNRPIKEKQTKITFTKSKDGKQEEHTLKLAHWERNTHRLIKPAKSKKVMTIPNISLQVRWEDQKNHNTQSILRTYH